MSLKNGLLTPQTASEELEGVVVVHGRAPIADAVLLAVVVREVHFAAPRPARKSIGHPMQKKHRSPDAEKQQN